MCLWIAWAVKPYSDPCFDVTVAASFSPTGPRGAGRHGIGMLSIAATAKQGMDLLAQHWTTWEEVALEHGHVADRSKWRLVGPMHLADTREQAEREKRQDSRGHVGGAEQQQAAGRELDHGSGSWVAMDWLLAWAGSAC